jgi:hypothetical protein
MSRGMFAQILWEDRRSPQLLDAGAPPKHALTTMLERTKVPRHPLGDEATVREETEFLLRCAAEVEHQFVVQYLYAAYSLDPLDEGPSGEWLRTLIRIAKEEMGHLLTVQNLLLSIGSQPYLERQTSPSPAPIPFPPKLEPFSLPFVSRFLVAESPADPEALPPELRNLKEDIDHVGAIYAMLYWLFQESDERVCPWMLPMDVPFPPGRHLAEADYADPGVFADRINQRADWSATGSIHVLPAAGQTTRQQIADAVRQAIFDIAAQGEGPTDPRDDPGPCPPLPAEMTSHFSRLLEIFHQLTTAGTAPVRPVPTDPQASQITHPVANRLARAMNLRYGLLMLEIAIAVFTRRSAMVNGNSVLGKVASWAIADMTLGLSEMGRKLVTLPLNEGGTVAEGAAAPPFTVPATPFPSDERGRWQRLIEILDAYSAVLREPTAGSDQSVEDILINAANSLDDSDQERRQFANDVLAQLAP